jgi:cation diffusion facilitator family transporter
MHQLLEQRICVVFSDTPEGAISLTFAADLNKMAGAGKLLVYVRVKAQCSLMAQGTSDRNADAEQRQRILAHVQALTRLDENQIEFVEFDSTGSIDFPAGSIVVDHGLVAKRSDFNVLIPFDEPRLDERGNGPFLIPFGDSESDLDAADVGLPIAQKLGRPVIFYHTTWRNAEVTSDDAREHMCDGALAVLTALEAKATALAVEFKTEVEMAPDVTEGILHCAVKNAASLIVVDRGRRTLIGSYVNQLLDQSPIPTLVAAPSTDVRKPLPKPVPTRRKLTATAAQATPDAGKWQIVPDFIRNNIGNPIFVMMIVAVMYVVKSIVKISLGTAINSPMLTGDGLHNIADIFEALAVILVIKVSLRPPSERYAYGRKNIEFVSAGAIGLGLIGMALLFTVKSVVGILASFPDLDTAVRAYIPLPAFEPLIMSASHFPWVVAATAGSVALSYFVSRYQISVGKKTGHDSLIADGQETASDGRIEMVALIGVLAEYIFHSPWIEYPLGIVIAFLIFRTGKELWMKAWHVLLQHSIGVEHDQEIRRILSTSPGVMSVQSVKTFQVGRIAVCHLTVTTRCTTQKVNHIKYAIECAVERYVLAQDFHKVETHINFQPPVPGRHREALAIVRGDNSIAVAPTVEEATSFLILDFEFGRITRATEEDPQGNPLALLAVKRVASVVQFAGQSKLAPQLKSMGVEIEPAVSYLPSAHGFTPGVLV